MNVLARAIAARRNPWTAVRSAATWPVSSQDVARRNAMVASTALTQRRAELREVEEFLAAQLPASAAGPRRRGAGAAVLVRVG